MTRKAQFASATKVPEEQSQAEITRLLTKHGAEAQMVGCRGDTVCIAFRLDHWNVRWQFTLPTAADLPSVPPWRALSRRDQEQRSKKVSQLRRSRWRRELARLKIRLDDIADGISTVDREFLADLALPGGATVGETIRPRLQTAHATGDVPPLLPGLTGEE